MREEVIIECTINESERMRKQSIKIRKEQASERKSHEKSLISMLNESNKNPFNTLFTICLDFFLYGIGSCYKLQITKIMANKIKK